ncbi:MAG: FAD-dependent oxidoreductase, partial [Acidimicrobiales bacterium]
MVVVGAGHNGLVAAAYLARAGLRPLVLERNDRVGGAVMSGEATCPGFVHDLFATNQNLFLGSGAWSELG